MKQIFRIFTLIAVAMLTAGQAWAETDEFVKIIYTQGDNDGGALEFYEDVACNNKITLTNGKSSALSVGTVYIKAKPEFDSMFEVVEEGIKVTFITAEVTAGTGAAGVRTRNGGTSIEVGDFIDVTATATKGVYQITMPADEKLNVTLTATFPEKEYLTGVNYIDIDGQTKQAEAYVLDGTEEVLGESGGTSSSPKETWYVCDKNLSYTSLNFSSSCNVNIILADGKAMSVTNSNDYAIYCHGSLGLYGQSTGDTKGALIAKSTNTYGNAIESEGGITISHCIVTAEGASYGIRAWGSDVTISEAEVTATGRYVIWSDEGGVDITGGTVIANGTSYGIRAKGSDKDITISGANVTAKATGTYGEAISTDNGLVSITGGKVTAEGASYGIRAQGSDKDVTISKAEVTATGDMAIWSNGGGVDITGGTVTANGTSYGIDAFGDVTISNSEVEATATGTSGNAIYGSRGVSITDASTVTANGTSYGINANNDVTISNSEVEATATGTSGYAIYGSRGGVSITGGTVIAGGTTGISSSDDIVLGWTNANDYIKASSYSVGYNKAVKTADGKSFVAYAPGATESDPMIATAIVSGNVIDPTTLNGKTLKPLDGYTITAPDGISLMDGTTAKTPDFTITTGAGTESEVTIHYYIYKASTEEDPVTVTLSYSGTDFVTLGSLPEWTTLKPVENLPMQRNLTFPAGDVALTTTAVTVFTVSDDTYICDGTVKTPTIMLGESTFEATNYTMAFEKNGEAVNEAKNVGTYSVVLTGLGQYLGTAILPEAFTIITQVKIGVVDIANGEAIVGATVQLIDSEDNVVREWNSTTDDTDTPDVNENIHVIEGLSTGIKYTLRETVAPEGYTRPTDINFTIAETGVISSSGTVSEEGVLLVENSKTKVEVSVVDVANGEEIEGATVQVLDGDGKVVEEWVSTDESHSIEGLKAGEEYTLRETVAPEGYTRPTDCTFTIDEDGKVTSTGTVSNEGVLLVENSKTHVAVSVVDDHSREMLAGVHVQVMDSEGVVEEWDSTTDDTDTPYVNENIHVIEGLKAGVEYTIHETIAPNGYALSSDTKFTIDEVGKITSTCTISEDGVLLVENSMTIDLTVTAVWEDNNNEKGSRPASVIVNLKVGDETIHSKELNATNDWTATVTGLAKYDQQGSNGSEIVYTWTPAPLTDDDYVLAPPSTEGTATTLTYNYYPAVTVTITGHNNETTYDGTEHTISGYEVTSISYSLYTASDFTFSGTASASQTNAGTKNMGLAASQFVNTNANYNGKVTFTIAADGYQTITPAPVTVKADDKSKEWGDADPALTATVTGMVNNEDANTLITYTVDREHGTIKDGKEYSGEYIITPAGDATQGNYAVTYETGKFTIKGKPTTIKNVDNEDVSSVENAFTITEDQDGVTLTLVSPDDNTLPPTVNIPKAVKVDHVNVDRIYVNGKASTVYLPFSIAYEKLSGGTFNTFTRVDETTDPWTVVYTEVTSGNIAANTPYIFLPDGSNGGKITVNNGVDEKITVSTVNQQATTQGDWKFIGTYKRIKWTHDKSDPEYTADREAEIGSVYGFAAEEKSGATIGEFVKVGNNVWINPMRAYLKRSTTTARAMTPGAQTEQLPEKMKVVIVRADGSLTKVGTLDTRTGEISLDEWYSLDGRRLSSKPTTKGVYINNGKTVVIK